MKKLLKMFLTGIITLTCAIGLTGCNGHANTIEHNIQKSADYFNVYRKITFINLYSDKVLYSAEGYFSLQTTKSSQFQDPSEIAIIFKTAPDEYSMNYFSVANNVTYVIEQTENTHTNPYYWEIKWYVPLPDIEIK